MRKMPYGWILLALISGILIGRISVHESEALPSAENEKPRRHSSTRIVEPSPHRDRPRERSIPSPSESTVSLPVDFGGKLLSDSKFLSCGFDEIGGRLEQALALLGATPGQREAVIDLFERTEREIYDTEKKHVGVRTSGASEIWLNMFDMEDHGDRILKNTRHEIAGILDPAQAKALNESIDWGKFYKTFYHQEVLLSIIRRDGILFRMENAGEGSSGTSLSPGKFSYNASSFSAADAFKGETRMDRRIRDWSHLLEGKTLVPIDKQRLPAPPFTP